MTKKQILNLEGDNTSEKAKNKPMGEIAFFGGPDRKEGKPDGKICSEYPAWYHQPLVDDLYEEIAKSERSMKYMDEHDILDYTTRARLTKQIKAKKKRIEEIEASRPKLRGKDKDDLYRVYQELGDQVKEGLFTRSEMKLGSASAQEEASRMVDPRIRLRMEPEIAKSLNLVVDEDGKVSRDQASKGWKILGSLLGEPTNVENLRSDRLTVRSRR